ncbi:MAG TPA: NUDIX domain-containing protein [Bacteriovoracaceae bacterium]|nr:NUDIX domain-containing protein [Bacteriovoracaceae bacterium]
MDFHRIKNVLQSQHTLLSHEWKGAVLFLCDDKNVYLIKRSEEMPTHGGQMAFLGGHKHINEISPWEVAQREFEEETSSSRTILEFLGYLPVVMTARLQPIIPVMARLTIPAEQFLNEAKSNGEWVDIVAYPWERLLIANHWEFAWRNGHTRSPVMFHTIKAKTFESPNGHEHPHLLWGATAGMIWDFLRLYFIEEPA